MKQHIAKVSGVTAGTTKKNSALFNIIANKHTDNVANYFTHELGAKKYVNAIQMYQPSGAIEEEKVTKKAQTKKQEQDEIEKKRQIDDRKEKENLFKTYLTHGWLKSAVDSILKKRMLTGCRSEILDNVAKYEEPLEASILSIIQNKNRTSSGTAKPFQFNFELPCKLTEIDYWIDLINSVKEKDDVKRFLKEYIIAYTKLSENIMKVEEKIEKGRNYMNYVDLLKMPHNEEYYLHMTDVENVKGILEKGLCADMVKKAKNSISNNTSSELKMATYIKAYGRLYNFITKSDADISNYIKQRVVLYVRIPLVLKTKLILDVDSYGYKTTAPLMYIAYINKEIPDQIENICLSKDYLEYNDKKRKQKLKIISDIVSIIIDKAYESLVNSSKSRK